VPARAGSSVICTGTPLWRPIPVHETFSAIVCCLCKTPPPTHQRPAQALANLVPDHPCFSIWNTPGFSIDRQEPSPGVWFFTQYLPSASALIPRQIRHGCDIRITTWSAVRALRTLTRGKARPMRPRSEPKASEAGWPGLCPGRDHKARGSGSSTYLQVRLRGELSEGERVIRKSHARARICTTRPALAELPPHDLVRNAG